MNIKIYFNAKFILFSDKNSTAPQGSTFKTLDQPNGTTLKKAVLDFVLSSGQECLQITGTDPEKSIKTLKEDFYYIEAAGGFIKNNGRWLCIHRFGRWDLPKGKLEKNESPEDASIRECEEECAVKGLEITGALHPTWHIYVYKDGYALKKTFWYLMKTDYTGELTPQLEENIDDAKWFSEAEVRSVVLKDTYFTIRDVITEALEF